MDENQCNMAFIYTRGIFQELNKEPWNFGRIQLNIMAIKTPYHHEKEKLTLIC